VIPQRSAAEEWKPQSQLQVSHGQTDLYQQLNHNHRPAIGRRPQPGAPVELPVNVDVMGRRLHPGAPGEYAAVPPPRRTSGDIRAGDRASGLHRRGTAVQGDDNSDNDGEQGLEEKAFLRMVQNEDRKISTELAMSQMQQQNLKAQLERMGGREDDEDEDDGNSKKFEVDDGNDADDEVALAHEDTQHHSELYKFMFGDHNEDLLANMEHEWLEEEENGDAGDGNDNDMPDSKEGLPEDDVQFADHVDDELGPDEETTNEMADSMFEDLDVAAKDGVVSFAEWWAVLTRDDPEARLATQRRVFSGIDTDGDGALSRAELRANWMSNDMLFLNTNDPALLDDDADAKNLPQFGPGAVVPPSEQPVPHRYSAAVSAMAAPTPGRRDSVDFQGPPHSAAGAGDSLGVTLKNAALRLFKQRAPRPQSLNVRLMTSDSKVSWAQADRQCKSVKKRLCPDMVLENLRMCHDKDPHHRGRWLPSEDFLEWVELDTCAKSKLPRDARRLPIIACC